MLPQTDLIKELLMSPKVEIGKGPWNKVVYGIARQVLPVGKKQNVALRPRVGNSLLYDTVTAPSREVNNAWKGIIFRELRRWGKEG